ncbi:MAG TPA: hypothetical protein VMI34_21215 [Candidatus Bathyarchaeia archaeon]|nr:hypothetical protein [Candidatus Bathyarchaeia archaeon]
MRFVSLFLAVLAILGALLVFAGRAVDPRGDFGSGLCPRLTMDSRRDKMRLFKDYAAAGPVGGLILGSSRSMKLDPKALESRLGVRFFNFSVDSARAEDLLAIYRWVRRQGVTLRYLVIGLDVEALHDAEPFDPRLQDNRELLTALRTGVRSAGPLARVVRAAGRYQAMFTATFVEDLARSAARCVRRPSTARALTDLDPDGYLHYVKLEADRRAGVFDVDRQIADTLEGYVARFRDMRELSPARRQDLEMLIREAKADGVTVKVWLTSLHPRTAEYLAQRTPYADLLARTRAYLGRLGESYGIDVYDYSSPERYGGSLTGWYDGAHIDEKNAELVASGLARP